MRHRLVTYCAPKVAEATFQALADPTRRAVLDLLRRGSQPAGQIANAFPVSRPAISKHLRLLRRAHLVREHREVATGFISSILNRCAQSIPGSSNTGFSGPPV
jgi:DNA-binding transcriptional ArsR family regulator